MSRHLGGKCVSVVTLCFALLVVSATVSPEQAASAGEKIVVANRGSGTLSVIDTGSDQVVQTVLMPMFGGDAVPEPMYVVSTTKNYVWVGDRANDRVAVFNGKSFELEALVPAGEGVFHMAADNAGHQLWVVNDFDRTATVIDAKKLTVIATVPMPWDLGAPHDVVLDKHGVFAYVTFLADDTVVQFETITCSEFGRATVGISPHVAYNDKYDELYLPCQGSDAVFVLDAFDLSQSDVIDVPNAHGTIMSNNGKQFYTTNIADGGTAAIQCINTKSNTVVGVADTPEPIAHNVALTDNGKKLYVTHSGTGTTVSVFSIGKKGDPVFLRSIPVGVNPFGLTNVD